MMLPHRKRPGLSLLGVLALCLLILSACGGSTPSQGDNSNPLAGSSPTQAPSGDLAQQQSTDNPDDVLKYWTSDKMLSAINADLLDAGNRELIQQAADSIKDTAGQTIQGQNPTGSLPNIPPMAPQDLQDLLQQIAQLNGQQGSTGTQTSASLLGAFSQAQPTASYSYPLSTVGKVFFVSGGRNFVCSGTSINSPNKSLVDTAGHCLYDHEHNGGWSRNWIFCPMYSNGNTPVGCWTANYFYTSSSWVKNGDFESDYGLVVVHPRSSGRLVNRVGGVGWAYNYSPKQSFHAYGYPAAKPFNGQTMKSCSGTSTVWKYNNGTMDMSIPCNMTGGSSGGPWLVKISGGWYVNGHNDFTWSKYPGRMFSPYYGNAWYKLYTKVANASPGGTVNR
ncbi:MAG: hypothetical protein J2P37_08735 [Ktedonobacteraceae bacterium]|nr:hypothetical protein [Ktedonobacteraceae bacterium]